MHMNNCSGSRTLVAESEFGESSLTRVYREGSHEDGTLLSHSSISNSTSTQSLLELEESAHVQHELLLACAVRSFGTKWAWRVRTCLALFCVAVTVLLDVFSELRYSCVVLMIVLDCGWLAYLLLIQPSFCNDGITNNSLTKLLSLPFMFLSPAIMKSFDFVCLLLWLAGFVLRDVFIMLFVMILSNCVQLHSSNLLQ